MKLEEARVKFSELQKKIAAFKHATSLIYYDGETAAPSDTLDNRTRSLMILNEEELKLSKGPETIELLKFLEENKFELTVNERRSVELMLKDYNRKKNIPPKDYVLYEKTLTEAQDAWHKAQQDDDFNVIKGYLEDIFRMSRDFAKLNNPDADPYQYWLTYYEEGLDVETCDNVFEEIKADVTPLLHEIKAKGNEGIKKISGEFSAHRQEALSLYVLELIGVNMDRCGFATAEHPFTIFLGSHFDERIATRYSKKNFTSSLYSVMHGLGHVLCDMGQADNLAYTALDGTASMVILESQAHFYENTIGRSREFIEYIYPEIAEVFPLYASENTPEDLYKSVHRVEPGLIRKDADELTYCLHTMIRFELEKALMRGDLAVKDLPDAWRELYKKHLELDVIDHKHGVLQDIHWPFGAIGYFPTYTIGSAYGVGVAKKMRETIDIEDAVSRGDFSEINEWNHERIWKHGGIYTSCELMKKFVKTTIDSKAYTDYLRNKYTEIYNL